MASNNIHRLNTVFSADPSQHIAALQQIQRQTNTALARVHAAHNQSQQSINRVWSRSNFGSAVAAQGAAIAALRTQLVALAPAIAAAFSVQEAIAAADAWTRFSNSLKVAGLEGTNLRVVQEALYASAQKNGVGLEALGSLYGSMSASTKDLGTSQEEILKITSAVTSSLRITGQSAQEASGMLLQLGQATTSPKIQAGEYNSLLDAAYPLLQAMAQASEEYGGSVARMTKRVKDGNMTNREFVELMIQAQPILEEKAAKAALTFGASMETLGNSLMKYIGEADQSLGVTAALGAGIRALAENLDDVVVAIAAVGLVLLARMTPQMVASTQAFVANALAATANTRAAIAMSAAISGQSLAASVATGAVRGLTAAMSGLLTMVGGPLGLAVIAITAGLAGLASEGLKTAENMRSMEQAVESTREAVEEARLALAPAQKNTKDLGDDMLVSAGHIKTFAGEVGEAAKQLYRLAAAEKAARINKLMLKMSENDDMIAKLRPQTRAARRQPGSKTIPFVLGEWDAFWSGGQSDIDKDNKIATLEWENRNTQAMVRRLMDASNEPFADEARARLGSGEEKKPKKPKTAKDKGPTAEEIEQKKILADLEARLAVAREAHDAAQIEHLEDLIDLQKKFNEAKELGLENPAQAARDYIEAIRAARASVPKDLKAADQLQIDPSFKSAEDRVSDLVEPLENAMGDMRERFRYGIAGALESAIYDEWPGLAQYMGDTLKRRFIENLADLITQDFFSGGMGGDKKGGLVGGAMSVLGSLFGGGRALGGPVKAGHAYVVGDGGKAETFVPGVPGTILPSVPNFGEGGHSRSVVKQTVVNNFDFNDAVLASTLRQEMVQAVQTGMAISEQKQAKAAARSQRNRLF